MAAAAMYIFSTGLNLNFNVNLNSLYQVKSYKLMQCNMATLPFILTDTVIEVLI